MIIKKILLSGVLIASVVACGDKSPQQSNSAASSPAQGSVDINSLLQRVPADTPYLFVNTQGMSDELYNDYMSLYAGSFEMFTEVFNQIEAEEDDADTKAAMQSLSKFYDMFSNIEDSQSLRDELGLSPNNTSLFYGAGIFPVATFQVHDSAKFSASVNELVPNGAQVQNITVDGVTINKFAFADDHLAAYWQISDQHAVFSLLPVQLEDNYLSSVFGDARPSNAFSLDQVTSMNNKYEFSGYGSGYFDLTRLYDQLVKTDTPEGAALAALMQDSDNNFLSEPACVNEIGNMLSKTPRMYFGITELSSETIGMRSILAMDDTVRNGLANVVGSAPINNDPKTPFNFGVNLNIAGLRDFVAEQSGNVLQSPFNCSHLSSLNDAAQQMNAAVNQPMLPMIGNINGFRMSLANIDIESLEQAGPIALAQSAKGHVLLYTQQPSMLIGLGQLTLPFLAELDLEPGGAPQLLENELIPVDLGPTYLATSDSAIGLSIGEQQQTGLSNLLNAPSDDEPVLFNFGFDYKLYGQFLSYAESLAPTDGEVTEEDEQFKKLMQQMHSTYENLGYTFGSVLINEHGLVTDQTMYLNQ